MATHYHNHAQEPTGFNPDDYQPSLDADRQTVDLPVTYANETPIEHVSPDYVHDLGGTTGQPGSPTYGRSGQPEMPDSPYREPMLTRAEAAEFSATEEKKRKKFIGRASTAIATIGLSGLAVGYLTMGGGSNEDVSASKLPDTTPRNTATAPVYPGTENGPATVVSGESLVDPETYPELVRTLHKDMAPAFESMLPLLPAGDRSKIDLNIPSDFTEFTGRDAAKYLSIALYTASIESKDGTNIDVEMARDTLATVVSRENAVFNDLSNAIDGTHSLVSALEAVGEDLPRLKPGEEFMGYVMPEDGGQVVKMKNNTIPGVSLGLFEVIEVGGEKTLLYVNNFDLSDRSTQQALQEKFGPQ